MLKALLVQLVALLFCFSFVSQSGWAQALQTIIAPQGTSRETLMRFNEAALALNSKNYVVASAKFEQVVQEAPAFAEAHLNYASSLQGIGRFSEALQQLRIALDIKPNLRLAWYVLGTCYQNLGKNTDAIDAYKQYLKVDPHGELGNMAKSSITVLETELKRTEGLSSIEDSSNYIAEITQNGSIRWPESRMPIQVCIKPGKGIPGYRDEFDSILKKAFQNWIDAAGGKIKIVYTDNYEQAAIRCNWTNKAEDLSSTAEGGQAVVVPDTKGIRTVKITILTLYPMINGPVPNNYLRRVCLHEVGHALGLYGHSRDPGDIMFCTIHPGDRDCDLSGRDCSTILTLYTLSAEKLPQRSLDMSRVALSGDPSSPLNRSIALNAEGAEALKQKNFPLALKKFELAFKTCPTNEFVEGNVGVCYAAWGAEEANAGQYARAEEYMQKALVIFEKLHDREKIPQLLQNLALVLRREQRIDDAEQVENKLKRLYTQ